MENYLKATSLISQTTLRSVLGQAELDELLSQRDKINLRLQEIIDRQTGPRFGSDWVIEDGLKQGERIVVEGLQNVRDGATVQPSTAPPSAAVAADPTTAKE